MKRVQLGLAGFAAVCLATGSLGCDAEASTRVATDVVLFGRVDDVYSVCFNVSPELTELRPSVACDPEGETPFAFNIQVEAGSSSEGETCAFVLRVDEAVPLEDDGTFQIPENTGPDEIPAVVGSLTSEGTVERGSGVGTARRQVEIVVEGMAEQTSCEVIWDASTEPVCFEEAAERCDLLRTCCDSIYLVPPIMRECQAVVDACDPAECETVLAGFPACPQPPLCTLEQDPEQVCEDELEVCCNTADLDQEQLIDCLNTAEACVPESCTSLFNELPCIGDAE